MYSSNDLVTSLTLYCKDMLGIIQYLIPPSSTYHCDGLWQLPTVLVHLSLVYKI